MKKVLLFVLAAFFACYTMNAQTPLFQETFDSGIPVTWTNTDADGDGVLWLDAESLMTDWGQEEYLSIFTYGGTGNSIVSYSYDNATYEALTPDNWLISAAIAIPSTGIHTLSWYALDGGYDDNLSVYVGTSNSTTALSATTPVWTGVPNADSLTQYTVSLAAYAGQTIYVAFRHHDCSDGFTVFVDQVEVNEAPSTPEIALESLTIPSSAANGGTVDITGVIKNNSSVTLTSFDLTYSLDGVSASTITLNVNVAYGETYAFSHTTPATITDGEHTIIVTVSNPNGTADNTEDNSLTTTIVGCDAITSFPYTETFDNGISGCWQAIDADGDGYNWMRASELIETMGWSSTIDAFDANGSATGDGLVSESYRNNVGAFHADNWLISPAIVLSAGGSYKATWYSRAGQNTYADSYSVYVGTSSDIATLAAGTPLYEGVSEDSFTLHELVLSDFAGQTVYFAIRHNDYDNYYLVIDQFSVVELSDNPEIVLTSITTPTSISEGESINVSGVVTNNSASALTSFDVAYTIDGTPSATYNVTGINVASGETYAFTHNAPITGLAGGNHTLVVTVSNPNGTADNTADNSLTSNISVCGTISVPYTMGFEEGMNCWSAISMNTENEAEMGIDLGYNNYGPTYVGSHSGSSAFMFSSYRSAAGGDYGQYLISPQLNLTSDAMLSFWHKSGYADETIQIMVSTTTNDIASFTALGAEIDVTTEWVEAVAALDANVKYVAIKYTSNYAYFMGVDDISLSELSLEPEIELVSAETNPNSVALNTNFNLKGVVKNNSGAPLTSFDLSYTFNNQTFNESISGINVALGQTYNFSIPVTGIATTGDYPITVTVSNPNGVADITTDNTQNTSINVYDASTSVPRTVLMENFTTAVCPNCPSGHDRIESAIGTTYANNVIWVSHHSGYYTDALTTTIDQTMMTFFNDGGATYAPAVMLDRTYWGDQSFTDNDPGPVFFPNTTMAAAFATATAVPAFVTVNISGVNYNATTRALSFTVSGNVTGALGTTDARLNAWLLEDGLLADGGTGVGHGPSQSGASGTFYHNHVIRENLSADDWGDAGVVNATSGNYTKTYTTTVSNNFDASKCYIVAFVSNGNHSNVNNCRVFNAGKSAYLSAGDTPGPGPQPQGIDDVNAANVKLYPNPTTGNLYIEVEGLQKVEVIDAVGRVVMSQNNGNVINMSNLANGIYTVRVMANGNTAVKKVVKK